MWAVYGAYEDPMWPVRGPYVCPTRSQRGTLCGRYVYSTRDWYFVDLIEWTKGATAICSNWLVHRVMHECHAVSD